MNSHFWKTTFILQFLIFAFNMSSCQTDAKNGVNCKTNHNDIKHIVLNAEDDGDSLIVDFYDHFCSDTVVIEQGMALMCKSIGSFDQIGEIDSIPTSKLTFIMKEQMIFVDNVLGFGKPQLSKKTMKILVPIVNYQYDDLEFGGLLLSLDFRSHRVDTIGKLINSIAMAVVDNYCYYINNDNLYEYNLTTGENIMLATLTDETQGAVMAFFSLSKSSSDYFAVTYYSDFTNDIIDGIKGKKAKFTLVKNS